MEDSNKSLGFVESLLKNATPDNFKSTEVEKPLDLEYDIGNLSTSDSNILNSTKLKLNKESYLKELARDDTQLLINKIWQLPTNTVEDAVVVKLPAGTTLLPREKPPPKAKPPTKWEQYAKEKGIQKRKKEKLVWDETQNDWKPRYGFKRIKHEKDDWVLEVPQNADPNTDMFAQKKEKKKERIAKNEFQRLRNLSKNKNLKIQNQGLVPIAAPSKDHVNKAITLAKTATASIGKFTDKLPEEKVAKNIGKKRKFESNLGDISKEKAKSLKILENLHNKEPKLDIKAAVNQLTHQEENAQAQVNQTADGKKGKGSKKTRGKKGSEKGKGGKRKFNPAGKNSKAAKRNMGKRKRAKA